MLFLLFCSSVFCSDEVVVPPQQKNIASGNSTPSERCLASSAGSSPNISPMGSSPNISPQRLPSPSGSSGREANGCLPPSITEWEGKSIDWSVIRSAPDVKIVEGLRRMAIELDRQFDAALLQAFLKLKEQVGEK